MTPRGHSRSPTSAHLPAYKKFTTLFVDDFVLLGEACGYVFTNSANPKYRIVQSDIPAAAKCIKEYEPPRYHDTEIPMFNLLEAIRLRQEALDDWAGRKNSDPVKQERHEIFLCTLKSVKSDLSEANERFRKRRDASGKSCTRLKTPYQNVLEVKPGGHAGQDASTAGEDPMPKIKSASLASGSNETAAVILEVNTAQNTRQDEPIAGENLGPETKSASPASGSNDPGAKATSRRRSSGTLQWLCLMRPRRHSGDRSSPAEQATSSEPGGVLTGARHDVDEGAHVGPSTGPMSADVASISRASKRTEKRNRKRRNRRERQRTAKEVKAKRTATPATDQSPASHGVQESSPSVAENDRSEQQNVGLFQSVRDVLMGRTKLLPFSMGHR